MQPLIIEASINESVPKSVNPHVPYGPDEAVADAVACVRAGASIVHYHARDPVTGENEWEAGTATYLRFYRALRAECPDVLVYPTQRGSLPERTTHLFELARDPDEGLELATVDVFPTGGLSRDDSSATAALITELRRHHVAFSIGVRTIGHMRHVANYHAQGLLGPVLVLKIFWNDHEIGPVPGMRGLQMYLDSVPDGVRCEWFNTVYDGRPDRTTLRTTSMLAAAVGGHIRTGIGENPELDGRRGAQAYTNVDHVRMAVDLGLLAGRDIADPATARTILGMPPRAPGRLPATRPSG